MVLRLISVETRKTLLHPAFWPGFGALTLLLGLIVFINLAQMAAGYPQGSGGIEDLYNSIHWINLLAYAAGAAVITAWDYPDRGIQIWLARGVPRSALLLARLATIFFFALWVEFFTVSISVVTAKLSVLVFFDELSLPAFSAGSLIWIITRLFWASLSYLALTTLFAVATRSPIYAAGGAILYSYVFETTLASLSGRYEFLHFLPGQLAQLLLNGTPSRRLAATAGGSLPGLTEVQAAAAIGIIALALSSLALLWFNRQELGG